MNGRLGRVLGGLIIAYSCLALFVIFGERDTIPSLFNLPGLYDRAAALQKITDPVKRDSYAIPLSAYSRQMADQLPMSTKMFMLNSVGHENGGGLGIYYFLANYVFPRELDISLGEPPVFRGDYYDGRAPTNVIELSQAGYNLVFYFTNNAVNFTPLTQPPGLPPTHKLECKVQDQLLAGVLPLLVAGLGMWLLPILFSLNVSAMGLGEKFACGMALGAFAISQIIFGLRLVGLAPEQLVFLLLTLGCVVWVVRNFSLVKATLFKSGKPYPSPWWLLTLPHLAMFAVFLWLASLEGAQEFDAVAGWLLKAKIIYLCRGHDIIRWFSESRLAHAHLDYPTLVPALHSLTYGAVGGVNEFVTKLWANWMEIALVFFILSVCEFPARNRFLAPLLTLAVICMPVATKFVQTEGATIPSLFFTTLGSVECILGITKNDKNRLWLGLFLLLGGAMTKFEGIIYLFLWIVALVCLKNTRALLTWGRKEAIIIAAAVVLLIPYGVMTVQIPKLHSDQLAFKTIAHNPVLVGRHVPAVFGTLMARQCVDESFFSWKSDSEGNHWTGEWKGLSSLFDEFNLGWGWLCLLLSIGLICLRTTRPLAIIITAITLVFIGIIAAIYCGLPYLLNDFQRAIDITADGTGGRHVTPTMIAWGLSLVILFVSTVPQSKPKAK